MYCNSCTLIIKKKELIYCTQCEVPLHKECSNKCLDCGKVLCTECFVNNSFKCEGCYKPNNKFETIRRSHLEQYNGCPYSVYLQLVLGMEPPMGSHAQLGVIVHELIDQMTELDVTLEEAIRGLRASVSDFNAEHDVEDTYSHITEELITLGIDCLNNFEKIKDGFEGEITTEKKIVFSVQESLPKISCTLDRIEKIGDNYHIHDWKTGRKLSGKKLAEDLQPALYIYSIYKEYGIYPETFTLHYLRDKYSTLTYEKVSEGEYSVKTSRAVYTLNIQEAVDRTIKILKGINSNQFTMPDEKSQWRCDNFCWFGISGKCKDSFNEKWSLLSNKGESNDKEESQ